MPPSTNTGTSRGRHAWVAGWAIVSPRFGESETRPNFVSSGDLLLASGLTGRDLKKLDRFSLLAVAGARRVLDQANLSSHDRLECGVVNGNMTAGWTFTEPQLRALYNNGTDAVSPYLASAWFPAAPQGQITIHLKLHGAAKTITTDRCAGAQAIGIAYDWINCGSATQVLAGGVEAPMTPFVQAVPATEWEASETCEGAAYLLLSSHNTGQIAIAAHETFPIFDSRSFLGQDLRARLAKFLCVATGKTHPDIMVVCNVAANHDLENSVATTLRQGLGRSARRLIFPARKFGDTLGASGAIAAAIGCSELAQSQDGRGALILSLGHQCADLLFLQRV